MPDQPLTSHLVARAVFSALAGALTTVGVDRWWKGRKGARAGGNDRGATVTHSNLRWGVVLGSAVIAWTAVVHLLGIYTTHLEYAETTDRLAILLPVCVLTASSIERLRRGAGSFGSDIGTGIAISAVSAPIGVFGLLAYHRLVNPEWRQLLVAYHRRHLATQGLAADSADVLSQRMVPHRGVAEQIATGLVGTIVFGALLSVLIAAAFVVVRSRVSRPTVSRP